MAFPLGAVLAAAPGVISAAADIIRVIRENKNNPASEQQPDTEKLAELTSLIERQAEVIEELAQNNRNLAFAARNNRLISVASMVVAVVAMILSIAL